MKRPCAASMPPMSALPYPCLETSTSRAPRSRAICWEPSVLPLSATMISADNPPLAMALCACLMHLASVSASSRQGITTVTSTAVAVDDLCLGARWATDIALEPNDWRGNQLRRKANYPDGSPLECRYLPCGLF